MTKTSKIRCAVYTRKSSEEGLDQDFNSLDAQREACEAFVASQRHEGWVLVRDRYDDGGLSGGTLDRPALLRLLENVEAGVVDRIVVYKVDRLTRSLADFAKLVERLEAVGASFVSVTQSFNTATSMGRLTLNVLLSFAQFEREVTAERIRDKIAASKKKGMWMGGNVPLGYDAKERALVVNEAEAAIVRELFERYLALGNVRLLKAEADRKGFVSKRRKGARGRIAGGVPFTRGRLYHLLRNPIYVGRIPHKGDSHVGLHEAIVDRALFERVQARLDEGRVGSASVERSRSPAPLAGKLSDETGDRLTPSHAAKRGRRYRYYVSRRLIAMSGERDPTGWRLPAAAVERAVADAIADHLTKAPYSFASLLEAEEIERVSAAAEALAKRVAAPPFAELATLVERVAVEPNLIAVGLSRRPLADALGLSPGRIDEKTLRFEAPFRLARRGVETKLVVEGGRADPDPKLLAAVARGRSHFEAIVAGETIAELAAREGVSGGRISRLIGLAFLDPKLVERIVEGRQPVGLTTSALLSKPIPDLWTDQRRLYGQD